MWYFSATPLHELDGLWLDFNYMFDVEVRSDFVPTAADGEVASFEALSVDELRERLARGSAEGAAHSLEEPHFTPSAMLANVDFLCRHGFISPVEGMAEYIELQSLLQMR